MAGLLASAFADRIARRRGQEGRYQLANGMGAMLDADDALGRHEWLIAPLLLQGSASPDARMLLALPVEIGELIAARPELAKSSDTVEWDEAQGTLKAWRRTVIGQLVIKTQPLAKPSEAELHQAMLNGIREKGLGVLNWTPEAEQLRLRLHCAAQWLPEEAWPAVDDASLLASLETWLLPQMNGVHSLRALKALDLRQALQDWLPWPLRQKLDRELPTHYTVPTGSRLAIRYHAENPPALAVRMQEMFGEATTPVIAEGRVPLVLELLSPAQRPLQITRDLSAFWQGSYREVQKEMKGRYPKHVWPDDPANAAPTRRSKNTRSRRCRAASCPASRFANARSSAAREKYPRRPAPARGRRPAAAAATAGSTGVAVGSTPARCRSEQQHLRQNLPAAPGAQRRQQLKIAIAQRLFPGQQAEQPVDRPQRQITGHRPGDRIRQGNVHLVKIEQQPGPQQGQSQAIGQQLGPGVNPRQYQQEREQHQAARQRQARRQQSSGEDKQQAGGQLGQRIAPRDGRLTAAGATAQPEETEQRDIVPPGDRLAALRAGRSRGAEGYPLVVRGLGQHARQTIDHHIVKAAQRQAEQQQKAIPDKGKVQR